MSEAALNLSGIWHGRYFYPVSRPPVPFVATVSEVDSWLTGTIEEKGTTGEARGVALAASIQGRRTGRAVTWLKLYDGRFRLYDSVRYEGDVNEDATEISGRWSIPGNWSGTFLMIRPSGIGETSKVKAVQRA
ncbi:MAG TPA: hypothetical protein VHA35_15635 [Dongiaceae bacterium]|nr:hypothetical protein [Dongiaceae bacterium]